MTSDWNNPTIVLPEGDKNGCDPFFKQTRRRKQNYQKKNGPMELKDVGATISFVVIAMMCVLTTIQQCNGFVIQHHTSAVKRCFVSNDNCHITTKLQMNNESINGGEDVSDNSISMSGRQTQQSFLEEQSRKGAKKISKLSIEERAQRAMIAEAVEDQMNVLQDELLEKLDRQQNSEGSSSSRASEEVKAIAKQIESLQNDYKDLVRGESSTWISNDKGGAFE